MVVPHPDLCMGWIQMDKIWFQQVHATRYSRTTHVILRASYQKQVPATRVIDANAHEAAMPQLLIAHHPITALTKCPARASESKLYNYVFILPFEGNCA